MAIKYLLGYFIYTTVYAIYKETLLYLYAYMLEQLNNFINGILGKLGGKPEYEEVGENLIKEDLDQKGLINEDAVPLHIKLPTPEVVAIAHDEDKVLAHKYFLEHAQHDEAPVKSTLQAVSESTTQSIPTLAPINSHGGQILRGIAYTFGALCLIGISYFVYQYATVYVQSKATVTQTAFVFDNPLVRADSTRTMSVEAGIAREVIRSSIVQTLRNEDVKVDKVTIVVPSYLRESNQDGKKIFVSEVMRADDFLFTFAPAAPLALRTAVAGEYALGLVNPSGKVEGFVAISMNDKVAGLREFLHYEPSLYADFKDTLALRTFIGEAKWRDVTVNNHDLRILSDVDGVILVYGFAASKTVVIAPNTDVFEKVSQRLK